MNTTLGSSTISLLISKAKFASFHTLYLRVELFNTFRYTALDLEMTIMKAQLATKIYYKKLRKGNYL